MDHHEIGRRTTHAAQCLLLSVGVHNIGKWAKPSLASTALGIVEAMIGLEEAGIGQGASQANMDLNSGEKRRRPPNAADYSVTAKFQFHGKNGVETKGSPMDRQ
jgi:hypothetical protein